MLSAIGALVEKCRTALDGLDATVFEGVPPPPGITTKYGLCVALGFNDDAPLTVTDTPIGAASLSDAVVVVRCLGQVLGPVDADLAGLRVDTAEMITRLDDALSTDKTLGGAVADAWIGGTQRYWPGRTNEVAMWTFAVDIHLAILD